MKKFNYLNPTEIVFGNGEISRLGELLKKYDRSKKLLLTYGKGSIKKLGIYDTVVKILKENKIDFVEFGGIKPNPELSHALEGIEFAKSNNVDGILAVGGGSVIDESKAIAAGCLYDGDVWDFYSGKAIPQKTLPLYVVLTVPATGSEMNMVSVLSNTEINSKSRMVSILNNPIFSILDPELTLSIPIEYTILASIDIIAHSIEAYFSKEDEDSYVLDNLVEGIVKTVIESMERLYKNPKDLSARENLMWAATMAWNGLVHCGTGKFVTVNHVIEHPLSAVYDIPHASGLAVLIPASMIYFEDKYKNRLARFGRNVFGLSGENLSHNTALEFGCLFKKYNVPTTLSELGINNPDIDYLAELAFNAVPFKDRLSKTEITEILKLAC